MRHNLPSKRPGSWFRSLVVSGWAVLVTSTALKTEIPYVHWYGTAVLVIVLGLSGSRPRWADLRFLLISGGLFVLSICTATMTSADPGYELLQAGKMAAILLAVVPLMTTGPDLVEDAMRGVDIAVAINVALVLAGALGHIGLGALMAPGRYGTVLNAPGSLWRLGLLLFASSGLRFFSGISGIGDLGRFAGSVLLLMLDGSRTGYLVLLFGSIGLAAIVYSEAKRHARRGRPLVVALRALTVAGTIAGVLASMEFFFADGDIGFIQRGWATVSAMSNANKQQMEELDTSRSDMLRDTIAAVEDHPVIGHGMGTTTSSTATGPMVVHIAYLQLWADVGILAFVAFTSLTIGCIPVLWRRFKPGLNAAADQRMLFYSGIFLLTSWAATNFLHAISTEISEWIMFVLGYACLTASSRTRAGRNWSKPANLMRDRVRPEFAEPEFTGGQF